MNQSTPKCFVHSSNINKIVAVQKWNEDDSMHGVIVQLPLPKHLNALRIQNEVLPSKDVDGLTIANSGRLMSQNAYPNFDREIVCIIILLTLAFDF